MIAAPSAMNIPRRTRRDDDPPHQDVLLQLSGHVEPGHDQDEHEEVVDAQ